MPKPESKLKPVKPKQIKITNNQILEEVSTLIGFQNEKIKEFEDWSLKVATTINENVQILNQASTNHAAFNNRIAKLEADFANMFSWFETLSKTVETMSKTALDKSKIALLKADTEALRAGGMPSRAEVEQNIANLKALLNTGTLQ